MKYEAIVAGVSSGGMNALNLLLPFLPEDFKIPLVIVQHIGPYSDGRWVELLNTRCRLNVKEADEKERIKKGNIYVAPANYHLLIERDASFSLSIDPKVNYARPSIDVLFESAAAAYKNKLIGVVLTGSNNDGAAGMKKIQDNGGLTIVQEPLTAQSPYMPASVIEILTPDYVLPLEDIAPLLIKLDKQY